MYGARLERLESVRPSRVQSPFPSQYILIDRRVDDSVHEKPAFHPRGLLDTKAHSAPYKHSHILGISSFLFCEDTFPMWAESWFEVTEQYSAFTKVTIGEAVMWDMRPSGIRQAYLSTPHRRQPPVSHAPHDYPSVSFYLLASIVLWFLLPMS